MRTHLETMLGIDLDDPLDKLAADLVEADEWLLDALILCRKNAGLSQAEVATRMGISQSAVARIESGERNPQLSTLRRYAHAVRAHVSHTVTPTASRPSVQVPPYEDIFVQRVTHVIAAT